METTIQQSEKLNAILSEIPQECIEMYQIKVDTFMSDKYKLYIQSPVWVTLGEEQIDRVVVYPYNVEIRCDTICICLKKGRVDVQIVVY